MVVKIDVEIDAKFERGDIVYAASDGKFIVKDIWYNTREETPYYQLKRVEVEHSDRDQEKYIPVSMMEEIDEQSRSQKVA